MASRIVSAYNIETGKKLLVPEHWIGHPQLGVNLSLTPQEVKKGNKRTAARGESEAGAVVLPSVTPATETGSAPTEEKKEAGDAEDHR